MSLNRTHSLQKAIKRGMLVPLCCLACTATPAYLPGTGDNLGTITHEGIGYSYEYQGPDAVVRTSAGGGFRVNGAGNLNGLKGTDGGDISFYYNDDNTITVGYDTPELGSGQVIVSLASDARVKHPAPVTDKDNVDHSAGADKCADLIETCENVGFFLEVIFPSIRTEMIDLITLQTMAEYPNTPQSVVSLIVTGTIDSYVNQALEFCAGVQLIEVAGAPPCDQGNVDPLPDDGTTTPPAGSSPSQVSIAASSLLAGLNETINFTAVVTGGTPPYTHWWQIASEGTWGQGTDAFSYTFNLEQPQTETVYCQIRDGAGVVSNLASVVIEGREVIDACPNVVGRYITAQGYIKLRDIGGEVPIQGDYGYVQNSADVDEGVIVGNLSAGAPGCPDCTILSGYWATGDASQGGPIEFTFQPGLKLFNGKWAYTDEGSWRATPWDGRRDTCD